MRILVLADEEDKSLWDYYRKEKTEGVDLMLAAGDLNAEYLSFLVSVVNRPLLYVNGNHDAGYKTKPPEGCDCIDGKLVTVKGLRIMGLGGSYMYNGSPNQYTEKQMASRINRMRFKLTRSKGVDIVLTHAPVKGYGDGEDIPHWGFECFKTLIEKYEPKFLIHGHVHKSYGHEFERERNYGNTRIINACGSYFIDIDDRDITK